MGNYLESWKDYILKEKWTKPDLNKQIDIDEVKEISDILSDFFPINDFSTENSNHNNWLLHILSNQNPSSFFLLRRIVKWLKYYNSLTIPEQNSFRFKNRRQFNYEELRDKLFELETNYILDKNNLNPICNESYPSSKESKKPMDSLFHYENEKYLVECKKIYSKNYEVFYELIINITQYLSKRGQNQPSYADELISGYIGFKGEKILNFIDDAEKDFYSLLSDYYNKIKKKNEFIIPKPNKTDNDNYIIIIEPNYSNKYENEYDKLSSDFDYFIKFRTWIPEIIKGKIRADIAVNITHKMVSRFVAGKLKEKIQQHESWLAHKIIVAEIENIMIPHKNGHSIPLSKRNLDKNEFVHLIDNRTSILFIFKTITKEELKYEIGFLRKKTFNSELSKILDKLEI